MLPFASREERRLERRRGAGVREIKSTFGFTFGTPTTAPAAVSLPLPTGSPPSPACGPASLVLQTAEKENEPERNKLAQIRAVSAIIRQEIHSPRERSECVSNQCKRLDSTKKVRSVEVSSHTVVKDIRVTHIIEESSVPLEVVNGDNNEDQPAPPKRKRGRPSKKDSIAGLAAPRRQPTRKRRKQEADPTVATVEIEPTAARINLRPEDKEEVPDPSKNVIAPRKTRKAQYSRGHAEDTITIAASSEPQLEDEVKTTAAAKRRTAHRKGRQMMPSTMQEPVKLSKDATSEPSRVAIRSDKTDAQFEAEALQECPPKKRRMAKRDRKVKAPARVDAVELPKEVEHIPSNHTEQKKKESIGHEEQIETAANAPGHDTKAPKTMVKSNAPLKRKATAGTSRTSQGYCGENQQREDDVQVRVPRGRRKADANASGRHPASRKAEPAADNPRLEDQKVDEIDERHGGPDSTPKEVPKGKDKSNNLFSRVMATATSPFIRLPPPKDLFPFQMRTVSAPSNTEETVKVPLHIENLVRPGTISNKADEEANRSLPPKASKIKSNDGNNEKSKGGITWPSIDAALQTSSEPNELPPPPPKPRRTAPASSRTVLSGVSGNGSKACPSQKPARRKREALKANFDEDSLELGSNGYLENYPAPKIPSSLTQTSNSRLKFRM